MLRAPCQRFISSILGVSSFRSCTAQPLLSKLQLEQQHSCAGPSCSGSNRQYSNADDYTEEVDAINEKFAEAREEIEYAREDAETVYFNESAEVARTAVADVLGRWQALLGRVSEDDQAKLQRSMGLKIEQLKAELKELDDLHA